MVRMTISLWTLLVAVSLPYVWAGISSAYRKKQLGTVDNHHPRAQQAQLTGAGARAYAAQQNAWEAVAVYTPAVLVAHIGNPGSTTGTILSLVWVGCRVVHGIFYISDLASLRSTIFTVGVLASVGLFFVGARVF